MYDKTIVTHLGALSAKYGSTGVSRISNALKALVVADKARGLRTGVVYLDDAGAMKKMGAKPLQTVADYRGAKAAVDGVFKALAPQYLMILGAPDVVPHQDLSNPAFSAGDDDDPKAWGDLPYACDTEYGHDPAQFVGPTRVVGRLPDLTGAREPSHLLALLESSAKWKCRRPDHYSTYFGLSASVWQGSTRLSLDNLFGNNSALLLAPPKGAKYPGGELGARAHFINCHGAPAVPEFYGQKGNKYPISLNTKSTAGAIQTGTVASVECCYGGELYDSVTLGLDIPICQSYLRQGAYGYLGSTTIAYGPADDNGAADLLCQYFLHNVLSGSSTGSALLQARQQFVDRSAQMDPIDLKTLAQFCLYGDPSVQPVAMPGQNEPLEGADPEKVARFRRGERRAKLLQTGEFLKQTKPTASKVEKGRRPPVQAKAALANIASRGGLPRGQRFKAFTVRGAKEVRAGQAKFAGAPSRYYLAIGKPSSPSRNDGRYRVAVVAKELGGRIVDYRIYHQR
ncbi:MAG TPA: hypothetical protein VKG01_15330 [Thermoanaerobaculia bacterium]|nr:hypothetical protein [Thermoanaerobaculia bacterium]